MKAYPAVNNEISLLKLSKCSITDHIQSLTFFFRSGPANFTLTCKAKSGNVGTQCEDAVAFDSSEEEKQRRKVVMKGS